MGDDEVEVEQLVRAMNESYGAVLPLVWENLKVMAYVRQGSRFSDAKRFKTLLSHGQAAKVTYAGRSHTTAYGAWQLRQEE